MITQMQRPRRRPIGTIFFLVLLAGVLGWALFGIVTGRPLTTPFGDLRKVFALERDPQAAESGPAEGTVRVLVSGRAIPAYRKITRDDLWDRTRNRWAYTDVSDDMVESAGIKVSAADIVGRVLGHEKSPGYVFTEKDFLPKGTRPGLAAGVPAGKRALRVDVDKVLGIVGLQPGDRFDIVAAVPVDNAQAMKNSGFSGLFAKQMEMQARMDGAFKQARVNVLVQGGVVVTPLETRHVPITSSSLTQGTTSRTIPVQEMVIALEPDEVAPLMEALSVEAQVTCLARSGRPDDPLDSETPSSVPRAPFSGAFGQSPQSSSVAGNPSVSVVETIGGGKRELVPVPSGGGAP